MKNKKTIVIVLLLLVVLLVVLWFVFKDKLCRVAGCNGELCVSIFSNKTMSICRLLPEHKCYDLAICEFQPNFQCGWTMTPEAEECFERVENQTESE